MDQIRQLIVDLQNKVENLSKGLIIKKITIPTDTTGYFVPKIVSADPATPHNNEIWIRSDTKQLCWYDSSTNTIKRVTLT